MEKGSKSYMVVSLYKKSIRTISNREHFHFKTDSLRTGEKNARWCGREVQEKEPSSGG